MKYYTLDCDCCVEVQDENVKQCDGLPGLWVDWEHLPNCAKTWALIGSGQTKGVFQLESRLGQDWSAKIKPTNLDEMAALISLIRPGCLRAMVDGKSMTQHYADRKAGVDEVVYFHEALEPILKETFGVLTYQEQSMMIALMLAGFTLQEADILRKAIGKKLPEVMAKVKKTFMEKVQEAGVISLEDAEEIFGWIQESQKYSFNKSHGIGYGDVGYWTAYAKVHFPHQFYCSWLKFAHEKMDPHEEMAELVADAQYFDIPIKAPSLANLFVGDIAGTCIKDGAVYFGISDIKGCGESKVNKLVEKVKEVQRDLQKPVEKWTWWECLSRLTCKIDSVVVNGMIDVGALSCMGFSRKRMSFEYSVWKGLTNKERAGIIDCPGVSCLKDGLRALVSGDCSFKPNARRMPKVEDLLGSIEHPPQALEDTPRSIKTNEKTLLGVVVTPTMNDYDHLGDTTCKEFRQGKRGKVMIAAEIIDVRESLIKNGSNKGKKMAWMKVQDGTGTLESVLCFADSYSKNKQLLYEGNTVLLRGVRSRDSNSFIVNSADQL